MNNCKKNGLSEDKVIITECYSILLQNESRKLWTLQEERIVR